MERWRALGPILALISCFGWHGCQLGAQTNSQHLHHLTPLPCKELEAHIDLRDRIDTLRTIAQAFSAGCDETVIAYGTQAQSEYRYKTFSVLKETSNIFLPDGTLIDYVLESYERGFLSVLLAMSYYRTHNLEAAKVELRKLDHEIFTPLYNYGADPVNLLFSAVLWEMLGEHHEAWVDWNRLKGQEGLDETIRAFATHRLNQMNAGADGSREWRVYAIGRFPGIDWDVQFRNTTSGYFSVTPQQAFSPGCSSESGVRISTASWFQKIAMRHDPGYHPLLHVQSWIRLPFGVVYSITAFTAGAGITIGGCYVDVAGKGDGTLCRLSVKGGMALMRESPNVLRYTLRPDLRHWDNVPSSFLFTTGPDAQDEPCLTNLSHQARRPTIKFFGRDEPEGEVKEPEILEKETTPEQLSEAHRLAREWNPEGN